ncbi:MAG: lysine-2,3-aminomutase-like protein [Rhodobacteraceae bacterium]|nr:lysine-2,3-aminomutase-like protein [Paracoccaceae bacterium]MCZ8081990.1 lysine-2,3-aminomutase-like protein [Paracoccaceae bacterium]
MKVLRAINGVGELVQAGLVAPDAAPALEPVEAAFRIRVTGAMQEAISAPDDPVARQFLPLVNELIIRDEELADPIGDEAHAPVKGLTHRYPDRVIFHVTKTCEVYCRFCFRREAVGDEGSLPEADVMAALDYIAVNPAIREVILTGGDPLVLSARRIKGLIERLSAIAHVDVVRIHTRIPVVAPEKVTDELVAALRGRVAVWVVAHTNHAQEITARAEVALARLVDAGIPLLSQSVLLRGVNDSVAALEGLFRKLIGCRVKPYYLHHCDLAKGTSHFRTTIAEGQALMAGLRGRVSGTLLPTYVLDIPNGFGKAPLVRDHAEPLGGGQWRITDWRGGVHLYQDPER